MDRPDPEWTVVADIIYSFPEPAWYSSFTRLRGLALPAPPPEGKAEPASRQNSVLVWSSLALSCCSLEQADLG